MKRWILTVLAVAMLAVTVWLGLSMLDEQEAARAASIARLVEVKQATADEIWAFSGEVAAEVAAWNGRGNPPDQAVWVEQWSGKSPPEGFHRVEGADHYVGFWRDATQDRPKSVLKVAVPMPDGGFRVAKTFEGALAERFAANPSIGEAPTEFPDPVARYSRLVITDRHGEPVWWAVPPRAPGDDGKKKEDHRVGRNEALRRIARGQADPYAAEQADGPKLPVSYKGHDSEPSYGVWTQVTGVPQFSVLAEISEQQALGDTLGARVTVFGEKSPPLYPWYATVGLAVLLGLGAGFTWVFRKQDRKKVSVLIRTYRFARPYVGLIVLTIFTGLLFSVSKLGRIWLAGKLFDDVLVDGGPDATTMLWRIGAAVIGLALLTAVSGYYKVYLKSWIATAMIADVRLELAHKILHLSLGFFDRMRAGDIVARIERDVTSLRKVLNQVFDRVFVEPFMLVGAVVLAFVLNSTLALVLLGLPIVIYPLFHIAKRVKKRATKRQVLLADISHVLFQMLMGIKVVKAFGGEQRETERLDTANRKFIGEARRIHRLTALSGALLDFLQMAGAAILMVGGGYLVLGGEVLVGDLVAFLMIVATIYKSAKELSSTANRFIDAIPGTERVFEIFDEQPDVVDGPEVMAAGKPERSIELRNVSFAYNDVPVLQDVSLKIAAGEIVALVGPTGAGKSTICDLVARFYDPGEGEVLFDGVNVRQYTVRSLLENVAVVTQDAFLFNSPIIENIRYARPDATAQDVKASAADAFVHDEIMEMDDGYKKIAGERGNNLSGGQRQRVTIARALLKDAPLLILDEATSALDTAAEKQVQEALDRLMRGRTVIVVAHRLSTIRNADKIVVLDAGRIVEQGPPAELLADPDSRFKVMYEQQLGKAGSQPPQQDEKQRPELDDSLDDESDAA